MIIKTLKDSFFITQTLIASPDINVYVAKKTNGTDHQASYILNEICNRDVINNYIDEFINLKEENKITDFTTLFTSDSRLYLVFKYQKPNLLQDYLSKNELSFEEKIRLVQNYLFQLSTATGLPSLIQKALTDLDNIHIHPDETVFFNYSIKPEFLSSSNRKEDIYRGISKALQIIFKKELSTKKAQRINLIIEKCNKQLYKSLPEIIKDLKSIDTTSFLAKIKKNIHSKRNAKLKLTKEVLIVGLTLITAFYIYGKFIVPATEQTLNPKTPVSQIGDVKILEEKEVKEQKPTETLKVNF